MPVLTRSQAKQSHVPRVYKKNPDNCTKKHVYDMQHINHPTNGKHLCVHTGKGYKGLEVEQLRQGHHGIVSIKASDSAKHVYSQNQSNVTPIDRRSLILISGLKQLDNKKKSELLNESVTNKMVEKARKDANNYIRKTVAEKKVQPVSKKQNKTRKAVHVKKDPVVTTKTVSKKSEPVPVKRYNSRSSNK
jgi:hypothetical protein